MSDTYKIELAACPACGLKKLSVGPRSTNRIVCLNASCPRPRAVEELLDPKHNLGPHQHRVEVSADGWSAEHPIIERLDGALHSCAISHASILMDFLMALQPGLYLVTEANPSLPVYDKARWAIERI